MVNKTKRTEVSDFCFACGSEQHVSVENRQLELMVRGEPVSVSVEVSVCPSCKAEVVADGSDPSQLAYEVYRERNRLLLPEQIIAIRKRYCLSQKAMALLIGMGEVTINRYERGALQDATHDSMIRAFDNPRFVLDALERRGKLLSSSQYSKALRRAKQLAGQSNRVAAVPKPWTNGLGAIVAKAKGAQDLIERSGSTWGLAAGQRLTA